VSLFRQSSLSGNTIDQALARRLAPDDLRFFHVVSRQLPAFRFVDVFQAIETVLQERDPVGRLASQHVEDLNSLFHSDQPAWAVRTITRSGSLSWPAGPEEETVLPVDHFWAAPDESGQYGVVIRLRYNAMAEVSILETAAIRLEQAEGLVDRILAVSSRDSIYRNQTIELAFKTAIKDEFGDVEKQAYLRVGFKPMETVTDDDIVIDEEVRKILLRNVVDLHERRALLQGFGVPARRGILLYGPPGTGKTYACRYLCGKLPNVTRILVTGSALLQVGQVFQLARLLQPAVLFLEDVDLVFMRREINVYSSILGELLDQMDGLRRFEDISFVMTTNAIERMEEAIHDRPGRISQCVRFGPPGPQLRGRYLSRYLEPYDSARIDLDSLVRDSEGATQAFLKEWVHRAVQVGSERVTGPSDSLELKTADFNEALREMRMHSTGSTARIIGFRD
jgi:ATP-dependent 26S proteasome regulatory subunit